MKEDRTINRMKAKDLKDLFEETMPKINKINDIVSRAEKFQEIFEDKERIIKKVSAEIEAICTNVQDKETSVSEVFEGICEDNNDQLSAVSRFEALIKECKDEINQITQFRKRIYGDTNEDGEPIKGFIDELDEKQEVFDEINAKSDKLLNKIETQLLAGATTISLAKGFREKVKSYTKATIIWNILFVVLISGVVLNYMLVDVQKIEDAFMYWVERTPVLFLAVWLGVFLSKKSAQSSKIAASYGHKESMALSYEGYKKSIKELKDDDGALLMQHMDNLLKTINEDSSSFLDGQGDQHPLISAILKKKPVKTHDPQS